jgi:hypothetical protein
VVEQQYMSDSNNLVSKERFGLDEATYSFKHIQQMELEVASNIWKVCPSCDAMMADDAVFCTTCRQKFPDNFLQ